jgi:hypothetical protein
MGQKFLISEGEKTHIRKLYGLITEAVEPYTQSQRVTFNPGYYGRTYAAPFLDPIIENIKKYLLDRPGERFVVNVAISSGESQIPNTDNEGVITGKAGTALAPKQLAIQRGVTITDYLNEKLGGLVESGVLPSLPKYTIADPKIGDTAWVGTPFCPAGSTDTQQRGACKDRYKAGKETTYKDYFNAYQQEQYLDMSITITELPAETPTPSVPVTTQTPTIKLEECASTIRVRFEIKKHNCQNAEFFVFANDTRLNNMEGGMTANLNTGTSSRGIPNVSSNPVFPPQLLNPGYGILTQKYGVNVKGKTKDELISGFKDAARWDDFEIPSSDKEKILSQSLEVSPTSPFINIWFECVTSDAHDDIVTITVYDGNNNVIVAPFSPKGSQGLLCTLDKCGKKIKTINDRIGPSGGNIRQARSELITYKEGLMSNLGLSGDTSTLDTKGLSLERTRTLLNKIKDIATKFNEYYTKMTASKNEAEKSNLKKSFKTYLESELTQFFRITMKSEGYEELLRKDPTDADSYPRSLIKSDMGGDLKNRMDTFYKYFNTFYRLGNTGEFLINNINQNTIYNISKNVNSDIT